MSVYFAQVGRYIKVGYSSNPERRVRNLFASATRYGRPQDIAVNAPRTLLAAVPGHLNAEGRAHRALDAFRVFGEWFLDEPEVRDYIAACVDSGHVLGHEVERPAGDYWWDEDPILAASADDQRALTNALNHIFAEVTAAMQSPRATP